MAAFLELNQRRKNVKTKKRVTAVTQTFVNLKSNTMKNTMQSYDYFSFLQ